VSLLPPTHGDVYSIQHYVIKFVTDLRQLAGFLRVLRFLFLTTGWPWYTLMKQKNRWMYYTEPWRLFLELFVLLSNDSSTIKQEWGKEWEVLKTSGTFRSDDANLTNYNPWFSSFLVSSNTLSRKSRKCERDGNHVLRLHSR
jgi:hypothetical protein